MPTLTQWMTRSRIGKTVRRWRRASAMIREMSGRDGRMARPMANSTSATSTQEE